MSKVFLHAPEKNPASSVSCGSLFNGTESAVGHPRGRGASASSGRQIIAELVPFGILGAHKENRRSKCILLSEKQGQPFQEELFCKIILANVKEFNVV